jgi:hypothetical protein
MTDCRDRILLDDILSMILLKFNEILAFRDGVALQV